MPFLSTILVVEDVIKSRALYGDLLGCVVEIDFGVYNVGFKGGLALYQKELFCSLTDNLEIKEKANNFVTYFEFKDINTIEDTIEKKGFEFIHKTREQPWGQKVFRFYDFDNYIVEVAEDMITVLHRMFNSGMTVDEIAKKTGYTVDKVTNDLNL